MSGELFGGEFGAGGGQFLFVVEDALKNFGLKIARLAKRVRRGTAMHGSSPLYAGGEKLQALGGFDEPLKRKKATSLWPYTSSAPNCLAGPPA